MRNSIRSLALLAITGCASAAPNDRNVTPERIIVDGDAYQVADVTITRDDYVPDTLLPVSRDALWAVLPAVYEEVGLPAPMADDRTWTVLVQNHGAMRNLGGKRMSTMLECGRGMTGAYADTHRIRLTVRTWLEAAGSSTDVKTRVVAEASSVEGTAGRIPCTSRGQLEARIADALKKATSGE
jgi:hypothetical protein